MSTSWTLTAGEICTDALEHLGAIGEGETPSAGDMQTCLRGLDGLLKELPTFGYHWPALAAEAPLVWTGANPFMLPDDYFNYPFVWTRITGERVPLQQMTHAQWSNLNGYPVVSAGGVTHFYITPQKTLYTYPNIGADPVIAIQYMKVLDDASLAVSPSVLQIWKNPLGYGVANEVALKFGATRERREEIAIRWIDKRDRALTSSQGYEAICVEVQE